MSARQRIINLMDFAEGTLTYRQIATRLRIPEPSVRREVRNLELDGYVELATEPNYTPREWVRTPVAAAQFP